MKYRILKNNGKYKIQIKRKWWSSWEDFGIRGKYNAFTNEYEFNTYIFDSYFHALDTIKRFAKKREKDKWRIIRKGEI